MKTTVLSSVVPDRTIAYVLFTLLAAYLVWSLQAAISHIFFHKLSRFPGPKLAAATPYYKTYIEGILQISWHDHLGNLHARYGPIVRVAPNELHFSDPQAYHDIYNNSNRWDKEQNFYHSFGEDRSSFGFVTYKEAKERKDVLNKSFSAQAIKEAQSIVQGKIDELCSVFTSIANTNQSVNLSYTFRCMTMDIITTYCFGASIDAIHVPNFRAPIILAMDAALPAFIWFKHSSLYKNMILKCPRPLSRIISPPTKGLVNLQELIENQITSVTSQPGNLDNLPHRMTIYHSLLNPNNYKSPSQIPSPGSLYEEAQALMFAGADTVGLTLMVMFYHLSQPQNTAILSRLQAELASQPTPPQLRTLESLPYLNATIKESLRLNTGVVSGLPRLTPTTGATITSTSIPPNTVVSIGSTFVHFNPTIFPNPQTFNPDRWLSSPDLDQHLVAFSRGPRSCLGINLAWMELRLTTASVLQKFTFTLEPESPKELKFRDAFLPLFIGEVLAKVKTR